LICSGKKDIEKEEEPIQNFVHVVVEEVMTKLQIYRVKKNAKYQYG